jgi:hypothetical protein
MRQEYGAPGRESMDGEESLLGANDTVVELGYLFLLTNVFLLVCIRRETNPIESLNLISVDRRRLRLELLMLIHLEYLDRSGRDEVRSSAEVDKRTKPIVYIYDHVPIYFIGLQVLVHDNLALVGVGVK